jgi:hypothetical protein
LALMLAVGLAARSRDRSRFKAIAGLANQKPTGTVSATASDRLWNLTGWLFLIGGFVGLECLEPYYFTQDDALVGELPGVLLGCRSLWAGVFPDWNPYVFLGAPLATIGFWAITYPPQLISYAIARHLLGNEFATLEVFAALHLIAGFIAMRYLCRRIGMRAMIGNIAALAFVYAGCIVIMGRSWQPFIANALWLPLLGIAVQNFRERPVGWRWILGVGLVLGLAYHSGFPQIVAILGMFLVVALATVTYADRLPFRRLTALVPALLLGVGLSAPLLLHHLGMSGGLARFVPEENGVYPALHAALLPYPLVEAELPTHWGSIAVEKMGSFYFFGGVFALLFAWQACWFWTAWPERRAWARCWWVPCGIFALLMVLGEPAYLWKALAALPMSNVFLRYSFRFYPMLAFCAILGGGLILDRLLTSLRLRWSWEVLVGAGMLGVLMHHLEVCQPSFYSYGFRPYPELPRQFESAFHPHANKQLYDGNSSRRAASWTQLRSVSPDYYVALPLNLPHFYQVPSLFGYDPVVEGQPRMTEVYRRIQEDPITACQAYGVGWHLFGYTNAPVLSPNQHFWPMEQAVNFEPVYHRLQKADVNFLAVYHGTTLMELPGAEPLAFVTGRPERPLPLELSCGGADIDVAGLPAGTPVTINFLWYPEMTCTLNGQALPVDKDDWQRVTTTLTESGAKLSLRFEPPWGKACALGAALCIAALVLTIGPLRLVTSLPAEGCLAPHSATPP